MSSTLTLRDCAPHPLAETLSVYVPGATLSEKFPFASVEVLVSPAETVALAITAQPELFTRPVIRPAPVVKPGLW